MEERDDLILKEVIKKISLMNREDLYFLYTVLRNFKHLKAVYSMMRGSPY